MTNTEGVRETSAYLSKKQNEGWQGSKGIHSRDDRHRKRRREKNLKNLPARLAAQIVRSQKDQAFRNGNKTVGK